MFMTQSVKWLDATNISETASS